MQSCTCSYRSIIINYRNISQCFLLCVHEKVCVCVRASSFLHLLMLSSLPPLIFFLPVPSFYITHPSPTHPERGRGSNECISPQSASHPPTPLPQCTTAVTRVITPCQLPQSVLLCFVPICLLSLMSSPILVNTSISIHYCHFCPFQFRGVNNTFYPNPKLY